MSPQTNYDEEFTQGLAGGKVNARSDGFVATKLAEEVTPFGVVVGSVSGQPDQGRPPISNTAVILDDAGTFTAGTLSATVNGVTVTITFATDKDTSMALLATAIQALGFITTAVYASGSNTITVTAAANVHLSVSVDVTGVTGTMTITSITYGMTDNILGLSLRDTIEGGDSRVEVDDRAVFTLGGDALTTSDTVDGLVNGVAMAQVTFATSEANTLQLVANALKALAGVSDAVIDATLRTVTLSLNPGLPLNSASLTVDDDTVASVEATFDAGVFSAQGVSISRNQAKFVPTEPIPTARKGEVYVQCEEAMTPASSVFVRIQATASFAQRGRIRTDIDSGAAVAAAALVVTGNSFTDVNGQLVVPVELNLP